MIQSKFLTNSERCAGVALPDSFSCTNVSPALARAFAILLGQNVDVAWRKVILDDKAQPSTKMVRDDERPSIQITGKFTGCPAFKELKNLIITILLHNSGGSKPQ